MEECLWGQLGRNSYKRKKELRSKEEGGKKIVWINKYGKIHAKIKSDNADGRNKDFQKRRKKN